MKYYSSIYDQFQEIFQFDIRDLISKCVLFLEQNYKDVFSYYSGKRSGLNSNWTNDFQSLSFQLARTLSLIEQRRSEIDTDVRWWELLSDLEDLDTKFQTLKNHLRWCRCSPLKQKAGEYVLDQNQSLEEVATQAGMDIEMWVDIAMSNSLQEEDYSTSGGERIKVNTGGLQYQSVDVVSVVDIIDRDNFYGKDYDRRLTFNGDDFILLTPQETLEQGVNVLLTMKKGDLQDQPDLGIQKSVIGSNRNLLNFPVINRQLNETFSCDDTIKEIIINNMSIEQDNFKVNLDIITRLNDILPTEQQL